MKKLFLVFVMIFSIFGGMPFDAYADETGLAATREYTRTELADYAEVAGLWTMLREINDIFQELNMVAYMEIEEYVFYGRSGIDYDTFQGHQNVLKTAEELWPGFAQRIETMKNAGMLSDDEYGAISNTLNKTIAAEAELYEILEGYKAVLQTKSIADLAPYRLRSIDLNTDIKSLEKTCSGIVESYLEIISAVLRSQYYIN
ncbi:MAG: hypothetical protein HFE62_06170 [Firmicutes bacterium]|nr:hypothetical protein [Bacillota bacterium]